MTRTTRLFAITSLIALVVASGLHLLVLAGIGQAWSAVIHLTLFGWITGMILTINYHTMPVFSGRDFPYPVLIMAHWAVFTVGILLATFGLINGWIMLYSIGIGAQIVAALVFVANTMLLFIPGQQRPQRPSPPPIADQAQVDRVGTRGTKWAGMSLPIALALLLAAQQAWISATWTLAAEHLTTLGWIMLMIVGVAYHVLPRFSGRGIRGAQWARAQLICHQVALILIVIGLGVSLPYVFVAGSALMTCALGLFAWTIWPTLVAIRPRSMHATITLQERPR